MIGDVVARPGRVAVLERIQDLREQHAIDFAVMNAENVAGGFSITPPLADELFAAGIDVMTSGNHIFDKREVVPYIERQPRLLRPANYPKGTPGRGVWAGEVGGTGVAVINLMGRVFMPPTHGDPFSTADELLGSLGEGVRVRLVDMHAEATSEKIAMAWHLDGRVSAVIGTHTHVQTADERVLTRGTAFITDVGMTGSHAGCIGMEKGDVIARFTSPFHKRAEHSKGDVRICAVVIDVDEATGRAREISRLSLPHES
jgi:metallophosphoesterase (TIGR00282 family)